VVVLLLTSSTPTSSAFSLLFRTAGSPVTGEPFVGDVVQVLNTTRLKQIKWWRTLEAGAFDVKEVVLSSLHHVLFCNFLFYSNISISFFNFLSLTNNPCSP
jgi:hypothetical protein